jgi:C-terminal processing protease CtpA/Prc
LEQSLVISYVYPASFRLDPDPGIAFLIIPTLAADYMGRLVTNELRMQLQADPPLKGLVIDLRGNPGGWSDVMLLILGQFVTGKVGDLKDRWSESSSFEMIAEKGVLYDELAEVPLVLLVDGGTASNAENMSIVLQEQGRARIVGVPSAGNTEVLTDYEFADGSMLWLAHWAFTTNKGTNLEGRGVVPDVIVKANPNDYVAYDNAFMSEAIALLQQIRSEK